MDERSRTVDRLTGNTGPTGMVLYGSTGIGKTWLAEAVVAELPPGCATEMFTATAALQPVPFGLFSALLPERDLALPESDRPLVLTALNHLRNTFSDRRGPGGLVLVIDDAHHLDDASSLLVHQLTLSGVVRPLLLVQDDEPPPEPIVALWKEELCERLDLDPLERDVIGEIAGLIAGAGFDQYSVDRLHELSGGNPALLRHLLAQENSLHPTVGGGFRWSSQSMETDVASLVEQALERLDPAARQLVELVAVGQPVPSAVIGRIWSLETLARLEQDGVVVVGDPPDRQVRLARPLWVDVLRSAISPAARAVMESDLADAFEATRRTGPNDRMRVLMWRMAAGTTPDPHDLVDAARTALAWGDLVLAERFARLAREHCDAPETDLLLALILETAGAEDEASELLDGLASKLSDDGDRAAAMCAQMRMATNRCDDDVDLGDVADAASLLDDPRSRDAVEAQRAVSLALLGDPVTAMKIALPLHENGDALLRLRSFPAIDLGAGAGGNIERALEVATSLLPAAMTARDELPSGITWVMSATLRHLDALGRLDDIEQLLSLLVAEPNANLPAARAFRLLHSGRLAIDRGKVATAAGLLEEAVTLYEQRRCPVFWPIAMAAAGEAAALRGDATRAIDVDRAIGDQVARDVGRPLHYDAQRARAWSAAAAGDHRLAIERLGRAATAALGAGLPATAATALHDALRLGAGPPVQSRLADLASSVDGELSAAQATHALGALACDGLAIEQSARTFERLGYKLVAADLCTLAARQHAARHDENAVRRCATRNARLLRSCEGAWSIPWLSGFEQPALSAAEQAIASLTTGGSTNREIAEQRGVSIRTVENHLGRIYKKLGVTNRSELADVLTGATPPEVPTS